MALTFTVLASGNIEVTGGDYPYVLPRTMVVSKYYDSCSLKNESYEEKYNYKYTDVTSVVDGETTYTITDNDELYDALKTVFSNVGSSSTPTSESLEIERLLDEESTDSSQNPLGLGVANLIQINFGSGSGTVSDPVMIDSSGTLTFNEAGTYRIKIAFQFGRLTNPGISTLLFRAVDGLGNQIGRSISAKLSTLSDTRYVSDESWLTVTAGYVIKYQLMRDLAGVNFGGLVATTPSVELGNEWNPAPCSLLRVERWKR